MNQHVGASSPLLGNNQIVLGTNTVWGDAGTNGLITLGVTNQWHFYIITNPTAFTNAAFATFLAPTLSDPRMGVTNVDLPSQIFPATAINIFWLPTDIPSFLG